MKEHIFVDFLHFVVSFFYEDEAQSALRKVLQS